MEISKLPEFTGNSPIGWVIMHVLTPQGYKLHRVSPDKIGAVGSPGESGRDGQDGRPGKPGTVWHCGEGVPDSNSGERGDFYLDTLTADVYRKMIDWVMVINLRQ